jgi:hypothetical protein
MSGNGVVLLAIHGPELQRRKADRTLGTDYVDDPNQSGALLGDPFSKILEAIGEPVKFGDETRATNLRLTGHPVTTYDHTRVCVVGIEVGPIGSYRETVAAVSA